MEKTQPVEQFEVFEVMKSISASCIPYEMIAILGSCEDWLDKYVFSTAAEISADCCHDG